MVVSWPPLIIGFFVHHKLAEKHVDKATTRQTGVIKEITAEQTRALLRARKGRLRRMREREPTGRGLPPG
jgi:hypothetical protein